MERGLAVNQLCLHPSGSIPLTGTKGRSCSKAGDDGSKPTCGRFDSYSVRRYGKIITDTVPPSVYHKKLQLEPPPLDRLS